LRRYLLIGHSFAAHLEFVSAIAGEDEVGVSVDKAGRYDAAANVDNLGVWTGDSLDLGAGTYGCDSVTTHQHCAILNDRKVAHLRTRSRP